MGQAITPFQKFLDKAGPGFYVDYLQYALNDLDKESVFSASIFEIWSVTLWSAGYDISSRRYVHEPTMQEIQENAKLGTDGSDNGKIAEKCMSSVEAVVHTVASSALTSPHVFRSISCEDQMSSITFHGWETDRILGHLLPQGTSPQIAMKHFLEEKKWLLETMHFEVIYSFYMAVSYRLLFSAHQSRSTRKLLGLKKGFFG